MQTELVASQWRIFFDGVEVPHQGFMVSFPVNGVTTCRIVMEPDQILAQLRPQTVVSIWARERYSSTPIKDSLLDQLKSEYYLYWEGLTSGVVHTKGTSDRSMAVNCEGFLGTMARAGGFMLGFGQIPNTSVLTGSVNFIPQTDQVADVRTLALLGTTLKSANYRGMSSAVMGAFTFLLSRNGLARLQERRYQILSRIAILDDATTPLMLNTLASSQFLNLPQQLPSSASILDVIRHIQSYVFYRMVPVPAPRPVDVPEDGLEIMAPLENLVELLSPIDTYTSTFRRNETVCVPDMYYAPPPPCNLILPDMLQAITVTRDFYSEPTRTTMQDVFTFNGAGLIHLAPPNISPGQGMTSSELFSFVVNQSIAPQDRDGQPSSYRYERDGGTVSSLEAVSTYEIEKGMVLNMGQPDFSAIYAAALQLSSRVEGVDPDESQVEAYKLFVSAATNYQHELARLNRTIQVDLHGHRHLVPGFSAAIFDSDASYMAYIDSLTFSVDPSGRESTQVVMSRGRVIPRINYTQLLDEIDAATQDILGEDTVVGNACTLVLEVARREADRTPDEVARDVDVIEDQDRSLRSAQKILSRYEAKLYTRLADIAEKYEIPLPPYFLSMATGDPKNLDRMYGQLLGCRPLYTSDYAPRKSSGLTDQLLFVKNTFSGLSQLNPEGFAYYAFDPNELADQNLILGGIRTYIQALQTLSNVYAIDETADRTNAPKNWQEVQTDSDIGAGTFEWAHRTFLKREHITLDRYLSDHNLTLSILSAPGANVRGMAPRTFAKMDVVTAQIPSLLNKFTAWDDSLFSKLVSDPGLGYADPEIARVRDALDSLGGISKEMLTTAGRQNFILNYSNKHFGSRAFNGS